MEVSDEEIRALINYHQGKEYQAVGVPGCIKDYLKASYHRERWEELKEKLDDKSV